MAKRRLIYEATGTHVAPDADRQTAILLIETTEEADLALRANWSTLERLRLQLDSVLSNQVPHADR